MASYRDGLGLPMHNFKAGADDVFFRLEGSWLAIYPRDELAMDASVLTNGAGFCGFTLAHNACHAFQ